MKPLDPSSQNFIELSCSDEDSNSTYTYRIDADKIETLTQHIMRGLGVEAYELSWNFVDDEEMQVLNREYREKDRSTDVLSFPQQEWDEALSFEQPDDTSAEDAEVDDELPPEMLGDVIISPMMALQNAKSIGHALDREVCFLLVHGILHLCGHDHMNPTEEERMTKEQQAIMKYLETITGDEQPLWVGCAKVELEVEA